MAKIEKVIVAKLTHDDKQYIGKRAVKMYEGDDQLTADANVGLVLRIQRSIREALKVKHGIKTVSTGGEAVDLSGIDEV